MKGLSKNSKKLNSAGILTIEAALILPIFIMIFVAILYFARIIIIQEQIQRVLTSTGLAIGKTAYVYDELYHKLDRKLDSLVEPIEIGPQEINIMDFIQGLSNGTVAKLLTKKELDVDSINQSFLLQGYSGISFYDTEILDEEDNIDLIVRYRIHFPFQLFHLPDLRMIQRVKLRAWTGLKVAAKYQVKEMDDESTDLPSGDIVYVAETGVVYHLKDTCTHLYLSVRSVDKKPDKEKNHNGRKYDPCELCVLKNTGNYSEMVYYITNQGDRYHITKYCSGLKRTVYTYQMSEVSHLRLCKRCEQRKGQ